MTNLIPLPNAQEPVTSGRWRPWFQSILAFAQNLFSTANDWTAEQTFSGGVNFGNETLSNYDEGTFTPTIAFGGASVGVTYTTQTASYTRIGNRVFFNIALAISNKGSSTGDVTIGTLPLSPATNVPVLGRPSNYTIGAGLIPVYDTNSTSIRLRTLNPTTGNVAEAQETQVDSDFSISLAGMFRV